MILPINITWQEWAAALNFDNLMLNVPLVLEGSDFEGFVSDLILLNPLANLPIYTSDMLWQDWCYFFYLIF